MTLPIVFEDRWLVVVDKPSGLATQADRTGTDNVVDQLRQRFPYVGLHHRLDRPASGLVLLTVAREANTKVSTAFRSHTVVRTYAAVLCGEVRPGCWDRPLDGRSARTDVVVLGQADGLVAAELHLHTGRTHQIRRHAALDGTPIAGDRRYGADLAAPWPRLALHAARLQLRHPITGAPLDLAAPLPDDLRTLWERAQGPVDYGAGTDSP